MDHFSTKLKCVHECDPVLRTEYIADRRNPIPDFIEYRVPNVEKHNLVMARDSRKSQYQLWIQLTDNNFSFLPAQDDKTVELQMGGKTVLRLYQDNGKLPLTWVFAGEHHGVLAIKWNGNEDNDSE